MEEAIPENFSELEADPHYLSAQRLMCHYMKNYLEGLQQTRTHIDDILLRHLKPSHMFPGLGFKLKQEEHGIINIHANGYIRMGYDEQERPVAGNREATGQIFYQYISPKKSEDLFILLSRPEIKAVQRLAYAYRQRYWEEVRRCEVQSGCYSSKVITRLDRLTKAYQRIMHHLTDE